MDKKLYVNADNQVIYDELADSDTDEFINDATLTFTVLRKVATDGVMTAASTTLTSLIAPFVAGDVGKAILVRGAGEQREDLRTTIATYVDADEVTLTVAASTTVSAAIVEVSIPNAKDVVMDYELSSDGRYVGILEDTAPLRAGETYRIEVSITAAGTQDFRRVEVLAEYRRYR